MTGAVIFDVDGTLVDSNDLHVEAWQQAYAHYGKTVTREAIRAQIGKGADQLMPVFLTPDELARYGAALEHYRVNLFLRDYLPRVQPFPGVRPLFEKIRADGMRIVLASSAKAEEVQRHLKSLCVEDLVDGVTSADDARHSKPCPDIIEAALRKLDDVSARVAWLVGDTPYDGKAAARAQAGMPPGSVSGPGFVAVLSGGFPEADLRASGAVAVYRDIADLCARYSDSPIARKREARTATG